MERECEETVKRVMIATSLDYTIKRVEGLLGNEFCFHICGDDYDLFPEIKKFKPDVLVVQVSRFPQERLQLLRMLRHAGAPIKVVALSVYADDYFLRQLSGCGVCGLIQLPCNAEYLASHIQQAAFAAEHPEIEEWCLENEIDTLLMDLSFRMGPARYQCVFEAIYARYMNMDCSMKELYIDVAKRCGGNYQRVEKAVRDAIADAYESGDKRVWAEYFPVDNKRDKPYPGNEDFIAYIAGCLHRRARAVKPYFRSGEKVKK